MRWWVLALAACGDPDREAAEQEAKTAAQMDDLEAKASAIRDAVVKGDLPDARAKAGQLASALPPLPPGPDKIDEQLKLALADVSGAETLADAAKGVGHVAVTCASCHVAETVGTAGRPVWKVPPTRPPEMARHAQSVDQLWIALIRGSDPDLTKAIADLDAAAQAPAATGIDKRTAELAHALASAPADQRAAAYGEILAMCATCHAANRPRAMPKIDGVALPDLQPEMDDHFVHALELQLAVVGGDLDAAHRAGAALAETKPPENVPAVAQPYLQAVTAAGDRASVAPTLADVAKATGDLALACASCHTASGGGPKDAVSPPPKADEPHMGVHVYGAWWMGYGLWAPDERAWKAGATALSNAHLTPNGWQPPPGEAGLDAQVHDLAKKALAAKDPAARAQVWTDLLQACAPCHQQLKK